jgi:2-dehydro-3-deoxyphosphogluconate aldolase / (4S)-4-hydroxy-2-oxoglutarate aldolase
MNKTEVCRIIRDIGIIPAIRVSSAEEAHFAADAITSGGIPIVEITMTVPQAVELIEHMVGYHGKILVGAGTVLDLKTAKQCIDAGASFLTAPGFDPEIVKLAVKEDLAVLPGALTPTEVVNAWHAGADFVKIFPCAQVGGDRYIKSLNTSLPQIPLIAAGGVNQHTAGNFILAGATAIGVGTELIPPEDIELRQPDRIRELAHRFLGFVREARRRLEPTRIQKAASPTDFRQLDRSAR